MRGSTTFLEPPCPTSADYANSPTTPKPAAIHRVIVLPPTPWGAATTATTRCGSPTSPHSPAHTTSPSPPPDTSNPPPSTSHPAHKTWRNECPSGISAEPLQKTDLSFTNRLARYALSFLLISHTAALAAPIPENVKKSVAFIGVVDDSGKIIPSGTGFFISVPNEADATLINSYLVTAKHVLKKGERGPWPSKISVRINLRKGGIDAPLIPLFTEGANKNVFVAPDATIDIAVIPALPPHETVDFAHVPLSLISSQEGLTNSGVSEGTEVFFAGLFVPHIGSTKNHHPIVRFGHVALLTDEKVNWFGVPTDLYLIESSSYGGNSGAPVFIYQGADRTPGSITVGPPAIRLLGVMTGAFQEHSPLTVLQANPMPVSTSNIGIAAVTPSYHLRNLLLTQEMVDQRKRSLSR
jgi:hypothetical protein